MTITFDAIVDPQTDKLITNPVNQGSVTTSDQGSATTNIVTTALDTLALGDVIYNDANGNGVLDGGDSGINGVTLTLFDDTNHNNSFDAGIDTQLATTTTAGGGLYSFGGLAPGDYIVRVDAANFIGGGALATYKNASPIVGAEPDNNIDGDNDGQPLTGGIVVTKAITLSYNNEPIPGAGNDTNNTLDIGLIQNRPPVLDLDFSTGGTGYTTTFAEDGSAVAIADIDVTVSDPDNTLLKSATVTIANFQVGEDLLAFTPGAGTGDIIVGFNAGGVLTLTSAAGATLAQWQVALQAVTYANTSQNPLTTDRIITVVVDDGEAINHASNTAITTVHITASNDAPVAVITPPTYQATEQTVLSLKNNGLSVSDVDGGAGSETITLSVGEGTLTVGAGTSGVIDRQRQRHGRGDGVGHDCAAQRLPQHQRHLDAHLYRQHRYASGEHDADARHQRQRRDRRRQPDCGRHRDHQHHGGQRRADGADDDGPVFGERAGSAQPQEHRHVGVRRRCARRGRDSDAAGDRGHAARRGRHQRRRCHAATAQSSVTITGTLAQINALLNTDGTSRSAISTTPTRRRPPPR